MELHGVKSRAVEGPLPHAASAVRTAFRDDELAEFPVPLVSPCD
jgi:hypothetical protein